MNKFSIICPDGNSFELPLINGTEKPCGMDASLFYKKSGYVVYDDGFESTASCISNITYIDGDKGILRYRGYDIVELSKGYSFLDVSFLLLTGDMPSKEESKNFKIEINKENMIHEQLCKVLSGFPRKSHPMALMLGYISSLSAFYGDKVDYTNVESVWLAAKQVIAKMPTLVAMIYKYLSGYPSVYPKNSLGYIENFANMFFSLPNEDFIIDEVCVDALNKIFILHADHEQNASTSTVRMCGSSGSNPFACIASGVASLWGHLHGGANESVIKMLQSVKSNEELKKLIEKAKDPNDSFKLSGFGHRVYKNFDPRADVLKKICKDVVSKHDNEKNKFLFDIAQDLESLALKDQYFLEKKLYPNVDFYSGIIMLSIGVPVFMFTPLFALARSAGWIAQWAEMVLMQQAGLKISRPRQVYTGKNLRS